jgi:cell division protein FtsB
MIDENDGIVLEVGDALLISTLRAKLANLEYTVHVSSKELKTQTEENKKLKEENLSLQQEIEKLKIEVEKVHSRFDIIDL